MNPRNLYQILSRAGENCKLTKNQFIRNASPELNNTIFGKIDIILLNKTNSRIAK